MERGMVPIWSAAEGVAAGAGDLRLRPRPDRIRLPADLADLSRGQQHDEMARSHKGAVSSQRFDGTRCSGKGGELAPHGRPPPHVCENARNTA